MISSMSKRLSIALRSVNSSTFATSKAFQSSKKFLATTNFIRNCGLNGFNNRRFFASKPKKNTAKPSLDNTLKLRDGSIYSGEVKNGMRHGNGYTKCHDGSQLEGIWSNDILNGQGFIRNEDGTIKYSGVFSNSMRHGKGVESFANGEQYKGSFVNGKIEGQGEYEYANGVRYKGEWKEGLKNGPGVTIDKNGLSSKVEYENGKLLEEEDDHSKLPAFLHEKLQIELKEGKGEEVYSDGSRYKGFFEKGKREKLGEHYDSDNNLIYQGEWVDGQMHGKGTYIYPDGSVYKGQFMNDMRHGRALSMYPKPKEEEEQSFDYSDIFYQLEASNPPKLITVEEVWENDESIEVIRTIEVNEERSNIIAKKGKSDKIFVSIKVPNGDTYEGEWKNEMMNGQGTYTFSDGRVYEGWFVNDQMHGHGKISYPEGRFEKGEWNSNILVSVK